jgi:uncharacterized SAM-binding protein YcdF (DUF218 family)
VARQVLNILGVPTGRVIFEDRSRTTHENAVMCAALIHPGKEVWLLVASASHMPRSGACFRHAGWNIYPAPADYLTHGQFLSRLGFDLAGHLMQITIAAHEYAGLMACWLMGHINSPAQMIRVLFTAPPTKSDSLRRSKSWKRAVTCSSPVVGIIN